MEVYSRLESTQGQMGTLCMKNIPFPKVLGRKAIEILIGADHPELMLALTEGYGTFGAPEARKMDVYSPPQPLPLHPIFSRDIFVFSIGELPQEAACCETLQKKIEYECREGLRS